LGSCSATVVGLGDAQDQVKAHVAHRRGVRKSKRAFAYCPKWLNNDARSPDRRR
jgi:hypothetical protein